MSRSKRLIDLALGGGLLVLSSPILAGVALAIRLAMGRPVVFSQDRPGLHGRPFRMFKFRSMRQPLPSRTDDASRITEFGRFLRRTSLDELPELLSVVKGDMSLVGPRPLLPEYIALYTEEQARRHEVKPGITGWAQVNGRNALSWEEKFELDVWYVDNWSLALDFRILWLTLVGVIRRRGISASGHATMPPFAGSHGNKEGS